MSRAISNLPNPCLLRMSCLAFILIFTFADAIAAVAIMSPEKDNTIYEGQSGGTPPENYEVNTCGAGANIFSGETDDFFARRALIKFDVATNIPTGSTINSVVLTLEVNRERDGAARTYTIHPISKDWGESAVENEVNCDLVAGGGKGAPANAGDATWLNAKFQQIGWDTVGGDFGSASGSSLIANGQNVTATWDSAGGGNGADDHRRSGLG